MTEVERAVDLPVTETEAVAAAAADESAIPKPAAEAEQKPQEERKQLRPEDVIIPPKPEKVPAPDEEAFKKLTADLEEQIQKCRKTIESVRGSFTKKDTGREAATKERADLRAKLQEAQKLSRAKSDEVNALREEVKSVQKMRDAVIAEETKLKGLLKITDLRILEQRVQEIDERLTTETFSLTEEKKMIAEREQLTSSKPAILAYQAKRDDIAAKKKAVQEVYDRMHTVQDELKALRDAEKLLRDDFEAMKAKQAEAAKQAPSLGDELRAAKDNRDVLVAQLQAARDDFYAKVKVFRDYERALRHYQGAKKKREWLEREAERRQRDESFRAEKESFDPLVAKRELCNTIIAALQHMNLDSTPAAAAAVAPAVALPTQLGGKDGKFYVSSKFSQQTVSFAKPKPKAAVEKPAPKQSSEPLRLPLKLLAQFSELHLNPPALASDVPTVIESLRAKASFFEGESKKAAAKAAAAKAAAAADPASAAPVAVAAADEEPTPPPSAVVEA